MSHFGDFKIVPSNLFGFDNTRNSDKDFTSLQGCQEQLNLLIHSLNCPQDAQTQCLSEECGETKRLLEHCFSCSPEPNVFGCNKVKWCKDTVALIDHWVSCTDEQCYLCWPIWAPVREKEFQMQNQDVHRVIELSLAILGLAKLKPLNVVDEIREAIDELFCDLDLPEYTPQVRKNSR